MPALEPGLIHERDKPEKLAQLQPTWALNSEWCRIRAHPAHTQSLRWNDCAFVLFFVRVLFYFFCCRIKRKSHPDHDDDFALLEPHGHRRRRGVLGGLLGGDDLQELHLVHWGKVVHADDLRGNNEQEKFFFFLVQNKKNPKKERNK